MITHTKCGGQQTRADFKYYPLIATTTIVVDNYESPYAMGSHNVRQLFKRIGDKLTLPTIYCSKCGEWFPFEEFEFKFLCTNCNGSLKDQHYFISNMCVPQGFHSVCIKCAAKICMKCKRMCEGFSYFYDNYYDRLRKLEREVE